jgi:hypothetical protein
VRQDHEEGRLERLHHRVAHLRQALRVAEQALEGEHRGGYAMERTAAEERRDDLRQRLRRARARRRIAEHRAESRGASRRPSRRPDSRRLSRREAEYDKKYPPVVRRKSDGKILIREDLPMWRRQAYYEKLRQAGMLDE